MDIPENDENDISSDSSDFINHVKGEHQPLYPGYESYTKLKALIKLYNLNVMLGMSDSCFSDVLLLIGSMLPEGNNIPSSFTEVKKTLCSLGRGYEKIHACPNDCLLYRGERDEDETTCRICKASRWKLNRKEVELEGVPAKVLWYFLLIPRLRNLFSTPHIAKEMTWHDTRRQKDGPTEEGNDIIVYLQPLIEDLQELWRGRQVYDAYKEESFIFRGILLWTISDYPALGNLSGNVIKGYNSCTVCIDQTKATMLVNYRKTVIMRHQRWLPRHHPYRKQKSAFDNMIEKEGAPIPLTGEQVFQRAIYSKVIDIDKLEKIQSQLVETLCKIEKHFPPSFFDVMIHLSIHLMREVKLCGPIFLCWMYPFERYMKAFKGYVRNSAHPEGCIAEVYVAEEAVECLVNFGEATTGLSRNPRQEQNAGRPLFGATMIKAINHDLHLAHLCFLQNSNDIRPYFD
ncbi:uncharacterized protein LOC141674348 [Apium graveolens]|uniref:uncharacterized protein LOC141674346 n=1 Tax=Apium graveolens TaxID=4045 RepID=UPI003D78CBBA